MTIVKAHAYGNDFILASDADIQASADRAALTRILCDRHRGIGADGVIFHRATAGGAAMDLLNADGSYSEVSGNGVRCLAAWIARQRSLSPGASVLIQTDAGAKSLELLAIEGSRHTFRAAMGHPEQVSRRTIALDGTSVDVVTLRVGNPQCVVLGALSTERLHRIAGPLAVHPSFPAGTNVELASVESPERVRILIWERGVGPTEASGTGACAAAVASIEYGGASRDLEVVSPGGAQRVEWRADGLYLTGWAELLFEGAWLA
ncbi:MAG TPA: diaminopimelate epimerase [Vicinamibacterales bacterium]|jgi:diaminopimelate epimerase|nr:diaminopimelate epimerase [Vicinamibacterales bacterium]